MSLFGNLFGNMFGNLFGDVGPAHASVTVRAYRRGYFGGQIREIDAQFTITNPEQYTPYWMNFVDAIPPSWVSHLEVLNTTTDAAIDRPLTEPVIAAALSDLIGPTQVRQ